MRLEPTKDTLRELYLKSGNQCAYPECTEVMIDRDGNFIGQICHIEAANPGGERYNESQSDEERRHFDNLMLMCYRHHIITNDTQAYTVDVLKNMKAKHEIKFNDIAATIGKSIIDWTENQKAIIPQNMKKMLEYFGWNFGNDEISGSIKEFEEIAKKLESIPQNTRNLFSIMLKRLQRADFGNDYVDPRIIEEIAKIDYETLDRHTAILSSVKLTSRINISEYHEDDPSISIYSTNCGYKIWRDIIDFCIGTGINIDIIIVDLNFSVVDK